MTIGGRDVVYIRQHQSSPLPISEIDNYVNDMRKHRFQDAESQSITGPLKYKDKVSKNRHGEVTILVKQSFSFILLAERELSPVGYHSNI